MDKQKDIQKNDIEQVTEPMTEKDLSQAAFAAELGIDPSAIDDFLKGFKKSSSPPDSVKVNPHKGNNVDNQKDIQKYLIAQVMEKMTEKNLSQAIVAAQIGISSSRLNSWLKEVYKGSNENINKDVQKWLATQQHTPIVNPPEFIPTQTAATVINTLTDAQASNELVVVYGGAGLGKTEACKAYGKQYANVWIVTISPAASTVRNALDEIATTLKLGNVGRGALHMQRAIIDRLKGSQGLLIIDEAQHLGLRALESIRAIFDATKIGVALVGNESVYANLTGGRRAAEFAQLYSRVAIRTRVSNPTEEDVQAIAEAWKITEHSIIAMITAIAAKPGGLRGVTKTLRTAAYISEGGIPSLDDVRTAWQQLGADV